jgi:hypothetical protein
MSALVFLVPVSPRVLDRADLGDGWKIWVPTGWRLGTSLKLSGDSHESDDEQALGGGACGRGRDPAPAAHPAALR